MELGKLGYYARVEPGLVSVSGEDEKVTPSKKMPNQRRKKFLHKTPLQDRLLYRYSNY